MANILIIDDDPLFCRMLAKAVGLMGHDASEANSLTEGVTTARAESYDVVFLDVSLPDGNGLEALATIKETMGQPETIIITGEGEPEGAELAIKNGAWDYIEKPSSLDKMTLPLVRALEYRAKKPAEKTKVFRRTGILGQSQKMTDCLEQMSLAASSEASVLITGETGTGKELFARAIHDNSSRSERPFVIVDCGALPETLIEHELFGHVRGAFTGADANREGLVKLADKGTLFLDEIGELPLSQQKAFLRVLQEKRYRPLGGKTEIPSDFRLVAATNKDLAELVRVGHFREDLLFRISSFTIHLPPLRDRTEDVKELALHRLDQLYAQYGLKPKGFSGDFLESLAAYDWPGNVRELYNVLEQALLAAKDEPILYPYHLPTSLRVVQARSRLDHKPGMHPAHTPRALLDAPPPWREYREEQVFEAESRYLTRLIEHTSGNITRAAEVSGLSRQRLHTLLKKHGMVRSYNRQPRKGDT